MIAAAILCAAAALVRIKIIMPIMEYNRAVVSSNRGEYTEAKSVRDTLDNRAKAIKIENKYNNAVDAMGNRRYSEAMALLTEILMVL